ncbi:magnesium and cobalt transport protein CorA [Kineococcus sp. SYSU DK004]|uniref:magnesium and cobalt transport protein CorA n=1 Tax=Kineococcus sp. SYSU DK004 TaxID=3383125 RepID=UPI003D7D99FB
MIADVVSYREGRPDGPADTAGHAPSGTPDGGVAVPAGVPAAVERVRAGGDGPGDFTWIALREAAAADVQDLGERLQLHPLLVEDTVEGHQRPKVERYGDTTFVVLKELAYFEDRSAVETSELLVVVGEGFVLTVGGQEPRQGVRPGERTRPGPVPAVRAELEADAQRLARGPRAVLHALMSELVDDYARTSLELERDVEEVEEQVFSPTRSSDASDAQRIYSLKREVLEVRRAAAPLLVPLRALVERDGRDWSDLSDQSQFVLRDVLDVLQRTVEQVEGHERLLTDVLNAHLARVSVQQNDDARRISAWAAMFAVPTLVAGVYGMNFERMPELHWSFGYPMALALMAGACLVLYRAFKRSGWI